MIPSWKLVAIILAFTSSFLFQKYKNLKMNNDFETMHIENYVQVPIEYLYKYCDSNYDMWIRQVAYYCHNLLRVWAGQDSTADGLL